MKIYSTLSHGIVQECKTVKNTRVQKMAKFDPHVATTPSLKRSYQNLRGRRVINVINFYLMRQILFVYCDNMCFVCLLVCKASVL